MIGNRESSVKGSTGTRRMLRGLLVALVAAVAAAGIWHVVQRPAQAVLQTVTVERGDLERSVTAVGALQPKEYVDVGTQVSGQLQKIHVAIGDRVSKGAPIAEIDPTRYESAVRNDRASIDSLRAQRTQKQAELELARLQDARNQRLLAQHLVSQDTADQSRSAAHVAEAAVAVIDAQLKAAEATLAGDQANLGYTHIVAPMSGTVVSQTTLEGQTVNATQSAPVIVRIANLDQMTVWAQVAEADVNRIQPGMPAYFTTLGMPGRRWNGTVRQVQPTPETANDVVLYNVLIDVDNADHLLLPSMTVQVFFVLGQVHDAPLVALNALTPDPGAGANHYTARVLGPQGPQTRQVVIVLANRTTAAVESGLAVGDRVVLEGEAQGPEGAGARQSRRPMVPHL